MAKRRRVSETRTPAQVLDDIGVSVQQAEQFASDVNSSQAQRHLLALSGLADAGYAVFQSFPRLKNRVTGFDDWYKAKKSEWESDPLLAFFTQLREQRTHEGRPPRGHHRVEITNFWSGSVNMIPRPPAAKAYTIDGLGRPAWQVAGPDGTTRPVPAPPPPGSTVKASFVPESLPQFHLGMPLSGKSLGEVCGIYVAYLRGLLAEARDEFAGHPAEK